MDDEGAPETRHLTMCRPAAVLWHFKKERHRHRLFEAACWNRPAARAALVPEP